MTKDNISGAMSFTWLWSRQMYRSSCIMGWKEPQVFEWFRILWFFLRIQNPHESLCICKHFSLCSPVDTTEFFRGVPRIPRSPIGPIARPWYRSGVANQLKGWSVAWLCWRRWFKAHDVGVVGSLWSLWCWCWMPVAIGCIKLQDDLWYFDVFWVFLVIFQSMIQSYD